MKKHIGIFKDADAVREALRTKDLFNPYLAYITDENLVMYTPWSYIDVTIDYQNVDTIDITADDSNTHRLDIRCYKNFYWECVQVSDGITDFDYSEGDTGYASRVRSNFSVSNNLGAARTLYIKFNFREEENGPVVYEVVATINQAKNENAIIGWYVDGQVTTGQINVPYTGGTAQISIEGAASWVIYDPSSSEVASGNTDQIVTVNIGQNPNEWESVESYSVNWENSKGDSYEDNLTYHQDGVPQPGFEVENAQKNESYAQYYVPNGESSIDMTIVNCENYEWYFKDMYQNIIASGSGNTNVSIPVVSNTGTTPVDAFEFSGQSSSYLSFDAYDPVSGDQKGSGSLMTFVMPNNVCVFPANNPTGTTLDFNSFGASVGTLGVYSPDGGVYVGTVFDSQSPHFNYDWSASETDTEWGWLVEVQTSNNMEPEPLVVEAAITIGIDHEGTDDRQYTIVINKAAYQDPQVSISNTSYVYDDTVYAVRATSTSYSVRVFNTIQNDVIEFSKDGGNTWTASTRYNESIQRNDGATPITIYKDFSARVIRNGDEAWSGSFTIAHDTSYRPYIAWDYDVSNSITINPEDGNYRFFAQPGNYTLESVDVTVNGQATTAMTVSLSTDGSINLNVHKNTTGYDIIGVLTAYFSDNMTYSITVRQPSMALIDTPLTFEVTSSGNIVWADYDDQPIEYNKNNGGWVATSGVTQIPVVAGDVVEFLGSNPSYRGNSTFTGTNCGFNVKGNIMSLIYYLDFNDPNYYTDLQDIETFSALFHGCSGLVSAANLVLPAENLTDACYEGMFEQCDNLTEAPELPAETLAERCYQQMFEYCTSLETAPELPAEILEDSCYASMFRQCSSLNYIKCLATDNGAYMCTNNWVEYVPSSGGDASSSSSSSEPFSGGTFVKASGMTDWQFGDSGIPNGWDVEDA